jgi:hypothetical protein
MYPQKHLQRRKISEALVIVALALVLIYIADAAVGQEKHAAVGKEKQGFLPLSAALRGMLFGASSIILFFASFGVGFGEKSKITTYLLIAGGAITGTSVLGAASMAKGGLPAFLPIVIVGYIILGLGIFRLVRKL